MTRLEALQQRFDNIRAALTQVHGKDKAFCAATLAHLILLDSMAKDGAIVVAADPSKVEDFSTDMHEVLLAVGEDICIHLGINPKEAIKLLPHFEEVLKDLYTQKG